MTCYQDYSGVVLRWSEKEENGNKEKATVIDERSSPEGLDLSRGVWIGRESSPIGDNTKNEPSFSIDTQRDWWGRGISQELFCSPGQAKFATIDRNGSAHRERERERELVGWKGCWGETWAHWAAGGHSGDEAQRLLMRVWSAGEGGQGRTRGWEAFVTGFWVVEGWY